MTLIGNNKKIKEKLTICKTFKNSSDVIIRCFALGTLPPLSLFFLKMECFFLFLAPSELYPNLFPNPT